MQENLSFLVKKTTDFEIIICFLKSQTHVSTFHQWNHIAGYIFPVVIALFIGSWSDKRGRKIPLLIGLTGKLIYVLALLLNIHYGKLLHEILMQ